MNKTSGGEKSGATADFFCYFCGFVQWAKDKTIIAGSDSVVNLYAR